MIESALRFVQVLGVSLFLGTIAAYVLAGALAGEPGTASFLQARALVAAGTLWITEPAFAVAFAAGAVSALRRRPARRVWLPQAVLAAVVFLLGAAVIAPATIRSHATAEALARGEPGASVERIMADKGVEDTVGGANLLLTLVLLALAVAEPRRPLTP
jgi:hypothetical protein